MPRKKTYRKRSHRRRYKRYRRSKLSKPSKVTLHKGRVIPDRYLCKLKYTQVLDMTPAAAATEFWVFRGNSCYDPDQSGAGAQPSGFDQLMGLYQKILVRGSKIVMRNMATSGSHVPCKVAIYPSNDSTTPLAIDSAAAASFSRVGITNGYGGKNLTLKNYMSTKRMFGVSSLNDEKHSYSHDNASNPTFPWYWHIRGDTLNGANIASYYAEVEITYYCEFWDRIDLGQS